MVNEMEIKMKIKQMRTAQRKVGFIGFQYNHGNSKTEVILSHKAPAAQVEDKASTDGSSLDIA